MKKLPVIALSLIGAATLAACGGRHYHEPVAVAPVATTVVATPAYSYPAGVAVIAQPGAYVESVAVLRPGFGRVEAKSSVVYTNGASAGLTRLTLRMDDGSMQVVDSRGPNINIGERVEITPQRYIRYPLG